MIACYRFSIRISLLSLIALATLSCNSSTPATQNRNEGQNNSNTTGGLLSRLRAVRKIESTQFGSILFTQQGDFFTPLEKFVGETVPGAQLKGVGQVVTVGNMILLDIEANTAKGKQSFFCLGRCLLARDGNPYWVFEQMTQEKTDILEEIAKLEHVYLPAKRGNDGSDGNDSGEDD